MSVLENIASNYKEERRILTWATRREDQSYSCWWRLERGGVHLMGGRCMGAL